MEWWALMLNSKIGLATSSTSMQTQGLRQLVHDNGHMGVLL